MKKLSRSLAFKTISAVILLLILFSFLVSVIGYKEFDDALYRQYAEGAFRIANTAALVIDGDRIDAYWESNGMSVEYQTVWNRLDQLCNASDATFIYVIAPDLTDYDHITFLFSTVNRNSNYSPYEVGYIRETTNEEYKVKYRALYTGEMNEALLFLGGRSFDARYHHITAMVPVRDTDGRTMAILCVQRQMDDMTEARQAYLRSVLLLLLILVIFVIFVAGAYLNRRLIRPVLRIADEAGRFATENKPAEEKLTSIIRNKDEIGLLADSIDRMEDQIVRYVENLTHITAEKERIGAELDIAKQIQTNMLPLVFPPFPWRKDFDIYATMTPAREVGGDFYDFFLTDNDHLALVIADVSGKGIPAALFMAITKKLIKEQAMLGKRPEEILFHVNNQLCDGNEADMFVTVWLAVLELSSGKGLAANAGHEHPAIRRKDSCYELSVYRHSPSLGIMPGMHFREHSFKLYPGDSLFVYTDGVPEATNEKDSLFGTDRMLHALNLDPSAPPQQLLSTVWHSIEVFVGEASQFDDITMLSLFYSGSFELTVNARIEHLEEVLDFVNRHLKLLSCPKERQMEIDIAVEELFVNIASYAYTSESGIVTIRIETDGNPPSIAITLIDSGLPYDPLEKPDPDVTLPADKRRIGGLGIYMVKKSMDEVTYSYENGQNILTIRKAIS